MKTKLGAEKYAEQVRRFLGPYGCQTKMLDYDNLLETAKMSFSVQGSNLIEVSVAISKLARSERSARVKTAILTHWPTPNILWPAYAPVRKWIHEPSVGEK